MRITESQLRQIIRQELLAETMNKVILDITGLIPGSGEIADITNVVEYAIKGKNLFAALSLISIIPEIGKVIGVGGRLAPWLIDGLLNISSATKKLEPDVIEAISLAKQVILKHRSQFEKIMKKSEEVESLKPYLSKLRQALETFLKQKTAAEKPDVTALA